MSNTLSDIVEIREVPMGRANGLLEMGYRLIAVEQVAQGIERQPKEGEYGAVTFFVGKRLVFIVGRTAEQRPIIDVLSEWNAKGKALREAAAAAAVETAEVGT